MIIFNPILGRRNIPMVIKLGLTLALTYITFGLIPMESVEFASAVEMVFLLGKELIMGYFIGYLIYAVLAVFMVSGELIDMQMGISMSKMYDPQSNISMPITGSIFNTLFMLMFFMSNAHLTLIAMMIQSFQWVGPGLVAINGDLYVFCVEFIGLVLTLALKLALPMIAVQLVTEVAVGIIMKAIPQINVFVINIQIKVLVGFVIIFALVPSFSVFIEELLRILMLNIQNGLQLFFV